MSNDIQKMSQDFQHRVREVAYFMWEAAGRPVGMAMQFWVEAEQQVFKTMQVATEAMMPSARHEPAKNEEEPTGKPASSAEQKKPVKSGASEKQSGKTDKTLKKTASAAGADKKQSATPAEKTATKASSKPKKTATTKKS
ncbi:MAG: DUF2934 domain-containing protein [Rhodospirillales bacterium]|nr:DUF2934 domain-containing protein [Rhodospirillales bacterium]